VVFGSYASLSRKDLKPYRLVDEPAFAALADKVPSPTYALVHHYDGRDGPIYHVDCYRLASPDDARDLDWDTLQLGVALLIEWPERAGSWAPRASRRVLLGHTADPSVRRVELA
jgi:tRNA threonylcarbamoyladenosine biosynthesis protein TsaE